MCLNSIDVYTFVVENERNNKKVICFKCLNNPELVIEKTQFSELASFQCFIIRPITTLLTKRLTHAVKNTFNAGTLDYTSRLVHCFVFV